MSRLYGVAIVILGIAASQYGAAAQDAPDYSVSTPPPAPAAPAQPAPPAAPLAGAPALPPVMVSPLEASRAAIIECREMRLRGQLSSYKESAQCSNPKIFAAWKAANYPHMDLITEWLDAREAASEKVDQKLITPKEFESQMDALTIRLTAEEQRRRAGLISSADGDLVLQLPAATQVIGVATPPGQERLAARKYAAARARAAATSQAVDPSSVASLSTVEPGNAGARGGVGGPFVPVRGQVQVVSVGEGSRGLYAHLASQRSETEARLAFRSLQDKYPILSGRDAVIRRADDGRQGTLYRVEIGPLSNGQADELCGTIKSSGGQCVLRYE